MKKQKLAATAILFTAATSASAQMIYEPYDYGSAAIGTNVANNGATANFGYVNPMSGFNWADAFTNNADEFQVAGGSLGFVGLQGSLGDSGAASTAGSTRTTRLPVSSLTYATPGTTLYYSTLLKVTDLTGLDTSGNFIAGFNNSVGPQTGQSGVVGSRLYMRQDVGDPTKYNLGIGNNNNSLANVTWAPGVYAADETVFVVGSYTINGAGVGGSDDTANLWINPSVSELGAPVQPTPAVTRTTTDITSGILSFVQVFGATTHGAARAAGVQMDELRIDSTWAGVAPAAGADWSAGPNWGSSLPSGSGSFVNFNPGGGSVDLEANKTVGTVNIRSATPYTLTTGNESALTFDPGAGGTSAVNVHAQMDATGPNVPLAGSHTISAPVALAANLNANIASEQTLTISGGISGSAGIAKYGAGTLAITGGTSSYTGGIVSCRGLVAVGSDADLGAAPGSPTVNITLGGGGLRFDSQFNPDPNRTIFFVPPVGAAQFGNSVIDTGPHNITLDNLLTTTISGTTASGATAQVGGGLVKRGSGTLTLNNTSNGFFGMTVEQGTVHIPSEAVLGPAPVISRGVISMDGGTLRFGSSFETHKDRYMTVGTGHATLDSNGFDVTFAGRIFPLAGSSNGGLIKTGAGTLTIPSTNFGGNNHYTGPTTIQAGTLAINHPANLGDASASANDIIFDGGALKLLANATISNNIATGREMIINATGGTLETDTGLIFTLQGTQPTAWNGAFHVTGGGTFALARTGGAAAVAAGAMINVASTATLDLGGATSHTSSASNRLNVNNDGTLRVSAASHNVAAVTGTGGTTVENGATLIATSIAQSSATLNGNAQIRANDGSPAGSNAGTSKLGAITFAAGQQLDLTNNKLIVTGMPAGSWNGADYTGVSKLVKDGRGTVNMDGTVQWDGTGIVTSEPDANAPEMYTTLAVAAAGDIGKTSFGGQSVNPTDALVMYTYNGDANLSGFIDADDYFIIDVNYNQTSGAVTYARGDFNYDGVIDGDDYFIIDNTFVSQGPPINAAPAVNGVTAVPEPAGLSLLALAAASLPRRRRRS